MHFSLDISHPISSDGFHNGLASYRRWVHLHSKYAALDGERDSLGGIPASKVPFRRHTIVQRCGETCTSKHVDKTLYS